MSAPLLDIRGLVATVPAAGGRALAVLGVDLALPRGGALALVGESGSGKTLLALAIPRLPPPGAAYAGCVLLDGTDVLAASAGALERIRGRDVGFVFQDTGTALDPLRLVAEQVAAPLVVHGILARDAARARAVELLAELRVPEPERAARSFPHQLSGGMRQRALVAMAVACRPRLVVLDEPTSALDPESAAALLAHVRALRAEHGTALLLVTHDLGLARAHAERVAVMYAGRIVEEGPAAGVLARPAHPYTLGLLRSLPARAAPGATLAPIPGSPPALDARPAGCAFHPRCALAHERCARERPELRSAGAGQSSACHFAAEVPAP